MQIDEIRAGDRYGRENGKHRGMVHERIVTCVVRDRTGKPIAIRFEECDAEQVEREVPISVFRRWAKFKVE